METDHYILLIQKNISEGLNPDEQQSLDDWIKASADNQLLAKRIRATWEKTADFERSPELDIDLEADFSKLQNKIKKEEATTKVVNMPTRRVPWMRIAAGFLLLLAAGFVINNYFFKSPALLTSSTANKEQKEIKLADGSTVYLNENTVFEYPAQFDGNKRVVKLKGEAFFDISKDSKRAFIIETTDGNVEVLGTKFNVIARDNDPLFQVQVQSGKVKMTAKGSDKSIILEKQQQGIFDKNKNTLSKSANLSLNELAWHTKKISFVDQALNEVVNYLEKHFNVEIMLAKKDMQSCPFSSSFTDKDIDHILKSIATVFGMQLEVQTPASNYKLNGGVCNE